VAEFESNEPVAISLPKEIAKFIAKADTDSSVIKKLLDERTGVPMRINQ